MFPLSTSAGGLITVLTSCALKKPCVTTITRIPTLALRSRGQAAYRRACICLSEAGISSPESGLLLSRVLYKPALLHFCRATQASLAFALQCFAVLCSRYCPSLAQVTRFYAVQQNCSDIIYYKRSRRAPQTMSILPTAFSSLVSLIQYTMSPMA